MHSKLITPPAGFPVTLDEAIAHLKVDSSPSDADYIQDLIETATEIVQTHMGGRQLVTQTWQDFHDDFPWIGRGFELARAPVASVTSVKYLDYNGVQQTLDPSLYETDLKGGDAENGTPHAARGVITPAFGTIWPVTALKINAMWVEYVVGYPANSSPTEYGENVPRAIKRSILLLIGHLYENRQAAAVQSSRASIQELPSGLGLEAILFPYCLPTF